MIDWHSHVLPLMDDGSKSVEESLLILKMQAEQGAKTVIATPHFYANDESVDSFLERRKQSYERIQSSLNDELPKVLLGAEVAYYSGISRMEGLSKLCIEGTRLLLLEMPFSKWTDYVINEIYELASQGSVVVILAHIERYLGLHSIKVFEDLLEYGVIMQVNASFFCRFSTKRTAIKLLRRGTIRLVGSDAHNLSIRPPRLADAYKKIEKNLGKDFFWDMEEYGNYLLTRYSN